uniref:Membrane transport protein MMPL domain-containing protein n=1 Tax=Alexandrium catenella TaxID=2925 RepID=A0A7S1S6E4_ALECA|mmetsp:Transcript_882/g.2341  ORF Transcript_882/g.2341 Transcript_882/m.2341 type:complete len:463 (+) Transcript_882:3-1391(+)
MQLRLGPLKPVPLFFVAIMSAVAVQGAYFASRLTPPSKPEEWFPNNHMWVGISQFLGSTYYSADFEQYAETYFVWGLGEMDFGTFNEYKPDDHPATVRYDASFDLSTRAAQQAFLDTCQQLRTLRCDLPGCKGGQSSYVMQSGRSHAVSCVLEDFQRWLNATQSMSALPQGAAFVPLMERFRNEASPRDYAELPAIVAAHYHNIVGIVNGRLQHVAIKVRSNMLKMEPYGTGEKVRTLAQDFAQGLIPSMPASMKSLKVASQQFADFDLGQELVSGLFSGMAIAGPLTFVVLLLSTRNIVLALYAVISVASIVVCVLGFCKSAMDYDLGVGEAIAGIIVIGYSVDYVVHFAHTYCEAASEGHKTREARAIFTIENMGSTVFAGALTTAGSGVFMFFCLLTFFTKMALLICMTIFFSFLFSLCLFMGLCFLIGPENDFGNICCCLGTGNQVIAPAESAKDVLP